MTDYSREPREAPSTIDLFTRLVDQMSLLFRKEVQLAKAEMSEKVGRVTGGATTAAIGGVLSIAALVILLHGAVVWLDVAGVDPRWGYLIVGVVVVLIGIVMMRSGMKAASGGDLTPRRTTNQLREDAAVVKEQVR